MFTVTTATGKTFQSDYAVITPQNDALFIRIVGITLDKALDVFRDPKELPLKEYPQFSKMSGYLDEGDAIKIVLIP